MINKIFGKPLLRDLPGSVFVFSFLVLLFSIFIAVTQVQRSQTTQSRADVRAQAKNCSVSNKDANLDKEEKKFLKLLNDYRKQKRLNTVKESQVLTTAASWMSKDMATKNYFDHNDSLKRIPDQRLLDCGYGEEGDLKLENIGGDAETAQEIFAAWKKSKEHNQNMLNKDVVAAGVARHFDENADLQWYWVLDMGGVADGKKSDKKDTSPSPTKTGGKRDRNGGNRKPTLTEEPTETPAPKDTSGTLLKVSIRVLGITGGKKSTNKEKEVEVFLFDLGNNQVANTVGTLTLTGSQYSGVVDPVADIKTGTYFVKVKLNNTLRKNIQPELQKITEGETTSLPQVTLYQGDFDGNNRIDLVDFNIFVRCFEAECPEEALVDLNEDGEINMLDHSILLEAFFNNQGS